MQKKQNHIKCLISLTNRRKPGPDQYQGRQADTAGDNILEVGRVLAEDVSVSIEFGLVEEGTGFFLFFLFQPPLFPLDLIKLNNQIIDMIQVGDLVHGPELFEQGLFRYEKRERSQLKFFPEHSDLPHLVVLFPHQLKVNIPKIHNKNVEVL
jgi:hypothetical protein